MATNNGSRAGPQLPQQFGRYHVQKRLGDGGMGSVYLVLNTDLQREEALKVPNFDAGDGAEMRERFIREARAAAGLDHPNLCPVYDVGERDGICYLTMRYLKGKLLSDYTGVSQPPRKAVEIVTKLAQALAAAHAKGVTHRDLKPNNIMMCAGVGPVVMDFGLAKQAQQQDRKLTRMGSILGTPAYMPPEQVKGDLTKLGPASDVYSLGVILFELLTGRLPFEGATDAEVYGKILYTAAPTASALRPGLSPALDVICRKALAKAPEDRYASMKALAADLIAYLKATPPVEGGGALIVSKGGTANVFQMPTVAPVLSKPATAPPSQVFSQPTQLRGRAPSTRPAKAPSSVRPPPASGVRRSGTPAPNIPPQGGAEGGGLSVGAPVGGGRCFPSPGRNVRPGRRSWAVWAVGLMLLGVLGAALVFYWWWPSPSFDPKFYLPNDCQFVVNADVPAVLKSSLYTQLQAADEDASLGPCGHKAWKQAFERIAGVSIDDVERLTAGGDFDDNSPITLVLTMAKDLDGKALAVGRKGLPFHGKTLLEDAKGGTSLVVLDNRTLLVGPTDRLRAALEREAPARLPEAMRVALSQTDAARPIAAVFDPPALHHWLARKLKTDEDHWAASLAKAAAVTLQATPAEDLSLQATINGGAGAGFGKELTKGLQEPEESGYLPLLFLLLNKLSVIDWASADNDKEKRLVGVCSIYARELGHPVVVWKKEYAEYWLQVILFHDSPAKRREEARAKLRDNGAESVRVLCRELAAAREANRRLSAAVELGNAALAGSDPAALNDDAAGRGFAAALYSNGTVSALIEALGDTDAGVRAASAAALGKFGSAAVGAAADLVRVLHDDNALVRAAAAEALGSLGPAGRQTALRPLFDLCADDDGGVVAAGDLALKRLGGLTKEDRPFVNEVLNNPRCDVRIRFRALAAVREMGLESADAAPLYVRALSPDQGPDVCGTAARLLGTVDANGKSAAFKALVAYGLSNSNTKVVDAVVDSLNKLGTPDASAADDLATILGNDKLTLRARKEAAQMIGSIGPGCQETVYPSLMRALLDPDPELRAEGVRALDAAGGPSSPDAVNLLAEVTKGENATPDALQAAARALSKCEPAGRNAAVALLATLLRPADQSEPPHPTEVRMAALDALTDGKPTPVSGPFLPRLGPFSADEAMLFLSAMDDDCPTEVSRFVMRVCGDAKPKAAGALTAVLRALENNPDKDVRFLAARAAVDVAAADADKEKVVQALASARKMGREADVRARVVETLGKLDSVQGTVEALADALTDEEAKVRQCAAKALADYSESGAIRAAAQLAKATKDSDPEVKASAARALYVIDPDILLHSNASAEVISALAEATNSNAPSRTSVTAAAALLKLHREWDRAVPAALDAFKIAPSDPDLTELAKAGLKEVGPEAASTLPALIAALKDPDKSMAARTTLCQEGLKSLRPGIVNSLRDMLKVMEGTPSKYDPDLCLAAIQTLGGLGPDAVQAYGSVANHCNGETSGLFPKEMKERPDIQEAALDALRKLKPPIK